MYLPALSVMITAIEMFVVWLLSINVLTGGGGGGEGVNWKKKK